MSELVAERLVEILPAHAAHRASGLDDEHAALTVP